MDDQDFPPQTNPNPTPKRTNTIHIGGVPVEFPYQPYGTQLAFMNRVISTLDRAQRETRCHALLESPTGTGKSLSLLCSTLAWQQNHKAKNIRNNFTHSSSRPNPEAVTDPINHGGGFIPETQPSGNPDVPQSAAKNAKKEKQRLAPIIFYSSRTHSQISQVIREYKKTSYRVPMAVLGSRKHYCTNPYLRGQDKVDEQCKLLLKNKEDTCPEFKNVHKVKSHPSLQKGGCHEVHDIEDLVKIGQVVKGCSYFAARSMAEDAELVFCPYNYIINPVIRNAMEVDISGSIIIFDEAHNIEDITRNAGSVDLDEEVLLHLQTELGQLSLNDGMTYQPLFEMIQDILSWIDRRKNTLQKREFQRYFYCWSGDKASKELQEANISLQSFPILQECAKKAIKAASEAESEIPHLSGMASTTLEGLFSSLNYFFSGNGAHACDYELSLQKFFKKDEGGWKTTFSLWLLNPAVVFKDIADSSKSVILTSGTLSPMTTFSSELGIQFGTCLEAPHVIDVESQVWAAAIANGPGNYPLNASYKTADDYAFQDAVGISLEEICKIVPGGCLVFFPSYKLLDKVSIRWQETGQWSRLNAQKSIFAEPRGSSQDYFEHYLKGYYNTIRHGTRPRGKKMGGKRLGLKTGNLVESTKGKKKEGAAFLAVCRGKVSEGIDFSDDNARVVVVVGIPFPNIYDTKVAQKKKFNDTYELSKSLLSGNEWYCQQAFRALNQATGRCIRHKFDYGAIIFLDERFHKDRNRAYISKWLRNSIKLYNCFDEALDGLQSFFTDVKAGIGVAANSSQARDVNCEIINSEDKKGSRRINDKVVKSQPYKRNMVSNYFVGEAARPTNSSVPSTIFDSPSTQTKSEVLTNDGDANVRGKYIDLDSDPENELRCHDTPLVALPSDDLELTIVQETPGIGFRSPESNSKFVPKDDHSTPQTKKSFNVFHEQSSLQSSSISNKQASPAHVMLSPVATLDKESASNANIIEPAGASPGSVSSDVGKRRKVSSLPSVGRLHEFSTLAQVPDIVSSFRHSFTSPASTAHSPKERNHSESGCCKDKSFWSHGPSNSDRLCVSSGTSMDNRQQIFCLGCKNPMGLFENDFTVPCSIISTSKNHLLSLQNKALGIVYSSTPSVDVLVADTSSIDPRVCEGSSGQGIWCKEDGCVFNSIFCPFCHKVLGVQVAATDALNIQFQNKMLLYVDCLEIKSFKVQIKGGKDEVLTSHEDRGASTEKHLPVSDIEKFAYKSPVQDSGGWRRTKSRMRLPRK
ncbi:uncharacterized protein LOC127256855 [Andrographis paniculata]|uniref:uncharacterized protein LOC127256855 n=1 Tax=Andrographis paniculata TaxID=175694 RepID=UPI0021E8DCF5|nr:uncharacterized protein LOC127256855 [Andrographis paniculata]